MLKRVTIFLFILLSICLYSFSQKFLIKNVPSAHKGVIDLTNWDFSKDGTINLNGEWEFYWKEILTPETIRKADSLPGKCFIKSPGSWTNSKFTQQKWSCKGYGTYHLIIKVSGKHSYYSLKINDIYTSYKVWINGQFITEIGKVDTIADLSRPEFLAKEFPIYLPPKDSGNEQKIDLIIQVSNFYHTKAGIVFPIYFGNFESVNKQTKNATLLNLLIIGILLIIGLNHVFLFIFRSSDKSNLYFGILCLVMILRNITTGDRLLSYWIPTINWEWLVKFDNFSGFGTLPLFALFLYSSFKKEFSKIALFLIVGFGFIISILIFSTTILTYNKFSLIFEIYLLAGGLFLTFAVLGRASVNRRTGAFLSFIGFIVLYSTAINDVLSNMSLVHTPYIASYGLVVFMILQSFIISRKSSTAVMENENLSRELINEKTNLENHIRQRTDELEIQNKELVKLREEELFRSWYNETYAQLSDILGKQKENISTLSLTFLTSLARDIKACVGVIYILNEEEEEPFLEMISSYGADKEMLNKAKIMTSESMVGSCFTTASKMYLIEIPEGLVRISSGLGQAKPKALLLMPLKVEDKVIGVIELGSFRRFTDMQQELVEKIAINFAISILTLQTNDKTSRLLNQYKEKDKELRERETEMQQNLEELAILKEKLQKYEKGE